MAFALMVAKDAVVFASLAAAQRYDIFDSAFFQGLHVGLGIVTDSCPRNRPEYISATIVTWMDC